jgi:crossover junction endodeoxyribonuclease RusA
MNWTLQYPARPWLLNEERAGGKRGVGGHHGRAALTREWRDAFSMRALQQKIPALETVTVEVIPLCRDRRRSDVGNVYPAAKAAIDGLVDAGVIPDDSDTYLQGLTFRPSLILGHAGLRLVITGTPCSREEAKARDAAYCKRLARQYGS